MKLTEKLSIDTILQKDKYNILLQNSVVNFDVTLINELLINSNSSIFVVTNNLYNAQLIYDKLAELLLPELLLFFPQDEVISSELLVTSEEFRLERMNTIKSLLSGKQFIVVTHLQGILKKQLPIKQWTDNCITVKIGDCLDIEQLPDKLYSLGYSRVFTVDQKGQYAIRGSIIDIYPFESIEPFRIELFDDEVDSIREFSSETQISIKKVKEFLLGPTDELFYNIDTLEKALEDINNKIDMNDKAAVQEFEQLSFDLRNRENLQKYHKYIEYFSNNTISLLDFSNSSICYFSNINEINNSFNVINNDLAEYIMQSDSKLNNICNYYSNLYDVISNNNKNIYSSRNNMCNIKLDDYVKINIDSISTIRYLNNFDLLLSDIKKDNYTVIVNLSSTSNYLQFERFLNNNNISFNKDSITNDSINLLSKDYYLSFELKDKKLLILTDENLYYKQKNVNPRYKSSIKELKDISSVDELEVEDYVVHHDYGIGQYKGITSKTLNGITNDYIKINYFGDQVLFIPIANIRFISKYQVAEGFTPKLTSLGTKEWSTTKEKVKKKLKSIAGRLIKLYEARQESTGYAFDKDSEEQLLFEEKFPFEETQDQLKSISEIKADMESPLPMDRVLIGDVGYGKTEVAMRAAFKAVISGKQVMYLAPTTVLSRQHYYTFKSRFEEFGISIGLMNRFVKPKDIKNNIDNFKNGSIDILIGTHRILSKDIFPKDLGLLIIDEEQRFGVTHKERIKEIKIDVDVLTLTATPIPRTLQMSLLGIRGMSTLKTPPHNRYPIQTYVIEKNDLIIKEAIYRELARKGQVFFLHNFISSIEVTADKIKELVPEARVKFAHGKLSRSELEKTINDFIEKKYDVLVSTTIIETGIDIPNANTLLIDEADKLGLSQLYQIRGRVGRSDKIAYCYLMTKSNLILSDLASKRLQSIKEFTELGSGFKIAQRDLEIRGAGDILGSEQSGFISNVGLDLYTEMLNEEINKLKGLPAKNNNNIKINFNITKSIKNDYIKDDKVKIEIHKKINSIETQEDIEIIKRELIDRFGYFDKELELYMKEMIFKKLYKDLNIEEYITTTDKITLIFSQELTSKILSQDLFKISYQVSYNIDIKISNNKYYTFLKLKQLDNHYLDILNDYLFKISEYLKKTF